MNEKIQYFLQQVREKDGEHEQAVLRGFFAFLIFIFLFIEVVFFQSVHVQKEVLVFSGLWLACAVLIVSLILIGRVSSRKRQWLTMFADISAVTYGMLITHETGILFYGIYLWVIVGNGLRYGSRALITSYFYSVAGFALVILINDFWRAHTRLSIGLLLTLILIPLYILKLRKQLNQAIEKATEANKAKSQFLANMSHEMRTPLHGVVGASELLMATPLNAEQIDLINTLQNSAQILLKLIENVLDLSKIESGKLTTETVDIDLHQLVHSTVDLFAAQALKKGLALNVRFTPETCFTLRGDALHLRQIIINLVGNAIKFTHKGMVELRISTLSQDELNSRLRFEVIDTGIGIEPESQALIFDSFAQADASITRKYGGTGLGTTIAHQLVLLLGGQIGMNSEPGIGSVFWFELPFEKQSVISSQHLESQLALARMSVMAVGLTVSERATIGDYLDAWGVRFEHETYLPSFFERLKVNLQEQPEGLVILCELQNLGVSAREFASRKQEVCRQQRVPMMMLNPNLQGNTEKELLELGYVCLLKSPLYKTVLFNALHGIMSPQPVTGAISLRDYHERHSQGNRSIRILVADDNGTNRKIIQKMLDFGGYQVDMAEDGEQALEMLEDKRYDLMILDLSMPVFGGLDVMKIHRASARQGPRIPVVILTANATVEAIRECEDAGVDAYLIKPVEAVKLLDTVSSLTEAVRNSDVANPETNAVSTGVIDCVPYIDENILQRLAVLGASDTNFLQTVVHGYISETEKLLDEMRTALSKQEYESFLALAHIMKGSSGNVGATALHQMGRKMMQLDREEFKNSAGELLNQAQSSFKSTKMVFFQYLNDSQRASR